MSLELIRTLKQNHTFRQIDNCPGVPAGLGKAIYGGWQDDDIPRRIESGHIHDTLLSAVPSLEDELSVLHFDLKSTKGAVHHFAALAWKQGNRGTRAYTVFMAYEKHYTVGAYVSRTIEKRVDDQLKLLGTHQKYKGYKDVWNYGELYAMISKLFTDPNAWLYYFGVADSTAASITCYRYKATTTAAALKNLEKY